MLLVLFRNRKDYRSGIACCLLEIWKNWIQQSTIHVSHLQLMMIHVIRKRSSELCHNSNVSFLLLVVLRRCSRETTWDWVVMDNHIPNIDDVDSTSARCGCGFPHRDVESTSAMWIHNRLLVHVLGMLPGEGGVLEGVRLVQRLLKAHLHYSFF